MSHLFVLSAHYRSEFWLHIQRRYLDAYVDVPSTRIFGMCGVRSSAFSPNETIIEYAGDHSIALDKLAGAALEQAHDDDFLLFLDSDAFPISPVSKMLKNIGEMAAVQRLENLGDQQPHPCFTLVTARTFRNLGARLRVLESVWGEQCDHILAFTVARIS